ncbi:leucine-rich repeat-containing protein 23 [Python bivittatus]|uniref:Leucine-rich repeat-containing protein 23 n=1 Tax=Python bivittatus TaxID=176946 RepID=A0A9F5MRC5_PYTBI|nr:leucine-rich repeat-containing protein 23 [Python bivittatus]XP_025020870.1 leucine-rich repeat-containing protein 23 [Python bivittatus]XP_025020875.1 leucine-rich repeat-containing protein 23 [Python bivittatus]
MSDEEPEDANDTEEEVEEKKEEGEGEGEEEEEEPQVSNPLTEEMLKDGLSLLCKIGNGLAHAFVKLEVKEKELTDITLIQNFIHLRYVDLSDNLLRDLSPLAFLTHLLWLKVDNNRLISAIIEELPYLQIASFANNHIKDSNGIVHPRLTSLNLRGNAIELISGLNPNILSNLHTLELRGNALKSTAGLYLPKLKNLYLAQNAIFHLEDLENLEQLTTLHLRDNMIEVLDGFSNNMKSLQYLNLRGNAVVQIQELEKLQVLPMLRALIMLDNPCSDESEYRIEALVLLPHLERLDKDFFEEEERNEAADIRQRRKEEELELEREKEREKELEEAEDTTQEELTAK